MKLYTCAFEKQGASLPGPLINAHPCAKAAKALDDANHTYEIEVVKGGSLKFWTWPSLKQDRAEIERLSGQRAVPILVLDSGDVIAGSHKIADWAAENPST